jgi:uncharacterized protein YjiS (DUF1127 family)
MTTIGSGSSHVQSPFQPTSLQPEGWSARRSFGWDLRLASRSLATMLDWYEVARQRRALRPMSDEMLKDIGISRTDAMREAGRRFWDTDGAR